MGSMKMGWVKMEVGAHIHFLLNFRPNCHQFWWKFWWFEEICDFLSDKIFTNSGDNNSCLFWVCFVTKICENFVEMQFLVKIDSPKIVIILTDYWIFWRIFTKMGDKICAKKISPKFVKRLSPKLVIKYLPLIFHQNWWTFVH